MAEPPTIGGYMPTCGFAQPLCSYQIHFVAMRLAPFEVPMGEGKQDIRRAVSWLASRLSGAARPAAHAYVRRACARRVGGGDGGGGHAWRDEDTPVAQLSCPTRRLERWPRRPACQRRWGLAT